MTKKKKETKTNSQIQFWVLKWENRNHHLYTCNIWLSNYQKQRCDGGSETTALVSGVATRPHQEEHRPLGFGNHLDSS